MKNRRQKEMTSEKILEMLHDGKIEELEKILQNEIYKKSLKNNGSAAKRYKAMERYFKNTKDTRKEMQRPQENRNGGQNSEIQNTLPLLKCFTWWR